MRIYLCKISRIAVRKKNIIVLTIIVDAKEFQYKYNFVSSKQASKMESHNEGSEKRKEIYFHSFMQINAN